MSDIAWTPIEIKKPIRMEIKASSEAPGFRFQQIRHPKMGRASALDYDVLLCLGVTAASLEFWFIPAQTVIEFIETGLFTNQHGGRKIDSNTYWIMADENARAKMLKYFATPETAREFCLSIAKRL